MADQVAPKRGIEQTQDEGIKNDSKKASLLCRRGDGQLVGVGGGGGYLRTFPESDTLSDYLGSFQ